VGPSPLAKATKLVQLLPNQTFTFRVMGSEIEDGCCGSGYEGGYYNTFGVDVQYPWESAPARNHLKTFVAGKERGDHGRAPSHVANRTDPPQYNPSSPERAAVAAAVAPPGIAAFQMDVTPVTNGEYAAFVASGYRPSSTQNYLRHWAGGSPVRGTGDQPVRWVSLDDARAFCSWRGGWVPDELEWTLAAQGPDLVSGTPARLYPWGDDPPSSAVVPPPNPRPPYVPDDVGRRRRGASPYGVLDMAGLVWEWTSEFVDERTRAAVLRGGSAFRLESYDQFGDNWYFPGGMPYDQHGNFVPFASSFPGWGSHKYPAALSTQSHAKLLLMAPSYDRSGAIGFRCAMPLLRSVESTIESNRHT
jgi:formylglycine-generating enzyme required for sulfatase activity